MNRRNIVWSFSISILIFLIIVSIRYDLFISKILINIENSQQTATTSKIMNMITINTTLESSSTSTSLENNNNNLYIDIKNCTINEYNSIQKQLPDTYCIGGSPWEQKCSFTQATKCVDSSLWFHDHHRYDYQYNELNEIEMNNAYKNMIEKMKIMIVKEIWIGMNVGCNKGFDAINMGRVISNGHIINMERSLWKEHMESKGTLTEVGCELSSKQYQPYFVQSSTTTSTSTKKPPLLVVNPNYTINYNNNVDDETITETIHVAYKQHVFCIEPVPLTYNALNYSGYELNLVPEQYMTITKAAIGLSNNINPGIPFPAFFRDSNETHLQINVGVENIGLDHGNCNKQPELCEYVPVMSLQYYYEQYVQPYIDTIIQQDDKDKLNEVIDTTTDNNNIDYVIQYQPIIKILSIDVEGYDYDVILGGIDIINNYIVEYIEFEYNWMGSWKEQRFIDIIDISLNDYICYFSGTNQLWKITGCFNDYYEYHTWSNVACVHRTYNPSLMYRMEQLYHETIHNPNISY